MTSSFNYRRHIYHVLLLHLLLRTVQIVYAKKYFLTYIDCLSIICTSSFFFRDLLCVFAYNASLFAALHFMHVWLKCWCKNGVGEKYVFIYRSMFCDRHTCMYVLRSISSQLQRNILMIRDFNN